MGENATDPRLWITAQKARAFFHAACSAKISGEDLLAVRTATAWLHAQGLLAVKTKKLSEVEHYLHLNGNSLAHKGLLCSLNDHVRNTRCEHGSIAASIYCAVSFSPLIGLTGLGLAIWRYRKRRAALHGTILRLCAVDDEMFAACLAQGVLVFKVSNRRPKNTLTIPPELVGKLMPTIDRIIAHYSRS